VTISSFNSNATWNNLAPESYRVPQPCVLPPYRHINLRVSSYKLTVSAVVKNSVKSFKYSR